MYSRELDGQVLEFAASGWVYINTFVLADFQTRSMWYPFLDEQVLRCVSGTYADKTLAEWPVELVPWFEWYAKHPHTKLLKLESVSL